MDAGNRSPPAAPPGFLLNSKPGWEKGLLLGWQQGDPVLVRGVRAQWVGPEERVIFLTDRSDFAQLLKDEGCMTHSMTHAADPLAQLEGRRGLGGRGEVTRYKLFLPLF